MAAPALRIALLLGLVTLSLAYHNLKGTLLCSACEVLVRELADRQQNQQKETKTIQVGHRLDRNNKPKMAAYKDSELAVVDLLEDICEETSSYSLRQRAETHHRFFSRSYEGESVDYYDDEDRDALHNHRKDLAWSCNFFIDEFNEELTATLRQKLDYPAFADSFCNGTAKVCTASALAPAVAKDAAKRAKWLKEKAKKERIRKRKEEKRREEERRKREEEDRELRVSKCGSETADCVFAQVNVSSAEFEEVRLDVNLTTDTLGTLRAAVEQRFALAPERQRWALSGQATALTGNATLDSHGLRPGAVLEVTEEPEPAAEAEAAAPEAAPVAEDSGAAAAAGSDGAAEAAPAPAAAVEPHTEL